MRKSRKGIEWRLIVNSYPCSRCGAPPGRRCRTDARVDKPEPHAERTREAAARGWASAEDPPRCFRCHASLPEGSGVGRCRRCQRIEDGPPITHATRDHPGPDGSYDAPLFGDEP